MGSFADKYAIKNGLTGIFSSAGGKPRSTFVPIHLYYVKCARDWFKEKAHALL
jgi:hypothetical protein